MNHENGCLSGPPIPDTITTLSRSVIQFGPLNNRVYLMKLDTRDMPGIVPELEKLAREHGLTKICAKVPAQAQPLFFNRGFIQEARIPGFFHGREDGLYMARFLDQARSQPNPACPEPPPLGEVHSRDVSTHHHPEQSLPRTLPAGMSVRKLGSEQAANIARIFTHSFTAYPFPLYDLDYISHCMQTHICFYGIEAQGQIAAIAASEMDDSAGHVEMTDFITLPAFRGHGLATILLQTLEQEMSMRGFSISFSIARAGAPGINTVFARQGYTYRGRLVQNTRFNDRLEDMNVWSKRL